MQARCRQDRNSSTTFIAVSYLTQVLGIHVPERVGRAGPFREQHEIVKSDEHIRTMGIEKFDYWNQGLVFRLASLRYCELCPENKST